MDSPFLPELAEALAVHRFRRVDDADSDLLLKRQTLNTNRAVVVVTLPSVPTDFRVYMNAVSRGVAKRCGYIPFLWGIGIQLVVVAPGITVVDPARHVALVDNQWAIVQSIFLIDPLRGEYRSARTWGQLITGTFQDAIEGVLARHFWVTDGSDRLPELPRGAERLPQILPEELPAFEERMRGESRYTARKPDFEKKGFWDRDLAADVLGYLSFNANGYLREKAVLQLAKLRGGLELRYLLLRMNDWVPQVREAAREAVLERMQPGYSSAFARSFLLVDRLERSERASGESLLGPLSLLVTPADVLEGLGSGTRATKRAIVRFALDRLPDARGAVVTACATSADDRIRLWIVPWVIKASDDPLPVLQKLAVDAVPAMRREALYELARHFPCEAEPYLERATLDTSAIVRETARSFFRTDFVALYRAAIVAASSSRKLAIAIAGLSETGADPGEAAAYLSHPAPVVRRAAIQFVMGDRSGAAFSERVAAMLDDPSSSVSSAARDALIQHAGALGRSRLMEVFDSAVTSHARVNVIRLSDALPKWQRILALLGAIDAADASAVSAAREALRHWNRNYNRSTTQPSKHEIEEVAAALNATAKALDPDLVRSIRLSIGAFS